MHARVTSSQMDPAQMDAALTFYQREILPNIRQAPGCHGIWVLDDRTTGQRLAISFWASEADMLANEAMYQDAIAKLQAEAAPPQVSTRASYEVLLQA